MNWISLTFSNKCYFLNSWTICVFNWQSLFKTKLNDEIIIFWMHPFPERASTGPEFFSTKIWVKSLAEIFQINELHGIAKGTLSRALFDILFISINLGNYYSWFSSFSAKNYLTKFQQKCLKAWKSFFQKKSIYLELQD